MTALEQLNLALDALVAITAMPNRAEDIATQTLTELADAPTDLRAVHGSAS